MSRSRALVAYSAAPSWADYIAITYESNLRQAQGSLCLVSTRRPPVSRLETIQRLHVLGHLKIRLSQSLVGSAPLRRNRVPGAVQTIGCQRPILLSLGDT